MTPPVNNTIWVDSRVGSKEFAPLLKKHRLRVEMTKLEAGDFMLEGRGPEGTVAVGVERKTLSDLIASLQSGRLQGLATETSTPQLPRMREAFDYAWLLVEGMWTTNERGQLCRKGRKGVLKPLPGGLTEDSLTKRLLTLELQGGLRIHQTTNSAQSAAWLATLVRWWGDKDWDKHTTLQVTQQWHGLRPLSLFRTRAMQLPGIGLAASKALELAFGGSEIRLLTASEEALALTNVGTPSGPRKLGTARARALVETFRKLRGE